MREFKYVWLFGLAITVLLVAVPVITLASREPEQASSPWDNVPERIPATDHSEIMAGEYESGEEVTAACLECHEDAAEQVMSTVHWTWESEPVMLPGREEPVTIGKKNQINNFCIGIQGNWPGCTRCHAGYGWEDADFDFEAEESVDCLVCHDNSGGYVKSTAGRPAEGVDLEAAAKSVGLPTRENCGGCHFNGGGGNAVKHGDLDMSLVNPPESIDVHMGRLDFQCVDCHQTEGHQVPGHMISVSTNNENALECTACHDAADTHDDERITGHLAAVACQTCHIPEGAKRDATKMDWDWSTAGQDLPEDPHLYLKIKGSFVYESNFMPEYAWFNGNADRYILGDEIDPTTMTVLNAPQGDIGDPSAKIWPFKIHTARQPYDAIYNILLQPKTVGDTGYWTTFDWDSALAQGSDIAGLPYSGEFGFAETEMYWPLTHMVAPKEDALQCTSCHSDDGRMDWEALGYPGDPLNWGGRGQAIISMREEQQ